MSITPLRIIHDVLAVNAPHHNTPPKSSRWNRNHSATAEYWFFWHNNIYPVPENELYMKNIFKFIKIPKLYARLPERYYEL